MLCLVGTGDHGKEKDDDNDQDPLPNGLLHIGSWTHGPLKACA